MKIPHAGMKNDVLAHVRVKSSIDPNPRRATAATGRAAVLASHGPAQMDRVDLTSILIPEAYSADDDDISGSPAVVSYVSVDEDYALSLTPLAMPTMSSCRARKPRPLRTRQPS